MVVPSGVNHYTFYKQAKAQGVKISSRYMGVTFNGNVHGNISWMARYQGEGINKFLGRFPFTEKGELEAHRKYQNFITNNNIPQRFKEKRKYKTNAKQTSGNVQ